MQKTVAQRKYRQSQWDIHFMKEARLVAEMSRCLSRHIGAVLVRDNHRIASGYNGPAKDVEHCEYRDNKGHYTNRVWGNVCPRRRMGLKSGEGMEHCPAVHGEINTVCMAAKFGIATEGTTLYCWCNIPCTDCAKELINAGVKRIVCLGWDESRPWSSLSTKLMCHQAGVQVDVITEEDVAKSEEVVL